MYMVDKSLILDVQACDKVCHESRPTLVKALGFYFVHVKVCTCVINKSTQAYMSI